MKKILVVDDEKIKRVKTVRLLKSKGFSVDEANNGAEAVAAIKAGPYDLMIIDNIMPKLTGVDACRHIKSFRLAPGLKIIMMLGYGEESDYPEIKELNINKVINKPIDSKELFAVLAELFGN